MDPNLARCYNNRGYTYNNLEQHERAIADLDKAIELDPNFAGAYNNRGIAFAVLGQYEKALEDFDKAIELYPNGEYSENRELVRSKLKEQNYVSGFEAIFAITGLLALAYLLRRETK